MSATNPQMSVPMSKPADICGHFSVSAGAIFLQTSAALRKYQLGLSFCRHPQLYASKPADVRKSLRKILFFFWLRTFADILDLEKIRH